MKYDDYEINIDTLAIVPITDQYSKVYETNAQYIIEKSSNSIIKSSCSYYGSSYSGRCNGSKLLTGVKAKVPIIIEESRNIIFFPTASPRMQQCSWIALNHVKDYYRKKNHSQILFNNAELIDFDISYYSLDNQMSRANTLKAKLYERKIVDKIH